MKAEEVIPATHRLEHSGMARNEAEAVISELQKVVAPLATKDGVTKLERSIARLEQSMATKEVVAKLERSVTKLEQSMATKDDLEKLQQTMTTKADVAEMETRLFRSLAAIMLGTGLFILSVLRFFPPS